MLKWQDYYNNRITSAQEAVKCIKSGDRVVLGHACGEPKMLPEAMVARASELKDVEVVHMVAMGKGLYAQPEMEGHFRHNGLFIGGPTRKAVSEERADYTPCFFSEIPVLFRENRLPVDVALVTVTPPDQHGFVSLGVSVDYTLQAIKSAKTVVAEVNPNMPRTTGDSYIKVTEIDYFVPSELPITELQPPAIGEVEEQIGRHIATLIDDGATLQLGIGAIPDAVLKFLTNKHDLGIHSEMFSDGVMDLVEAGVVTCEKKTLHPGKMIVTFLMGTKKLYKWVDENPMVEMYPVDYVNDPYVVMRNDKMVAINSALQVDALGQVAADTLGPVQFSGVGGQVDFVRGAARSKGGRAIIALPSTAAKGKVSRIVPTLDHGASVTTSRNDIDYVVTEYGIAALRGKTVRQRMEALVNIAHPDFRDEISQQIKATYFK
ncbi:MAG: acetyl-CoA hydrolase/transferase C-terminal domain-containing protein [Bacillota bacterium]|nr:acetyl-CoA hydrolase/transferase C-terminal domain-containing protein [Bacillota bacterium]